MPLLSLSRWWLGPQVKEAMLRSEGESIAQLTAALEAAQRDASDAAVAAVRAEKEALSRSSEAAHQQRALRSVLAFSVRFDVALHGRDARALTRVKTAF